MPYPSLCGREGVELKWWIKAFSQALGSVSFFWDRGDRSRLTFQKKDISLKVGGRPDTIGEHQGLTIEEIPDSASFIEVECHCRP